MIHDSDDESTEVDPQLAVYRHDVHKLRGRSHLSAAEEFAGVPVNEPVPHGADGDAAMLSRPFRPPEQTVANHWSTARLSLLTRTAPLHADGPTDTEAAIRDLVRIDDAAAAHRAWLDAEVPGLYNELVYYPYTSLRYHTLLTAALLSNYRDGASFGDLWLVADDPEDPPVPHRTVLSTAHCSLRVTHEPDRDRPCAKLGPRPARSFADVWARLSGQPLPVNETPWARVLDAQLRRVRAWSTALQYVDDVTTAGLAAEGATGGVGRDA